MPQAQLREAIAEAEQIKQGIEFLYERADQAVERMQQHLVPEQPKAPPPRALLPRPLRTPPKAALQEVPKATFARSPLARRNLKRQLEAAALEEQATRARTR